MPRKKTRGRPKKLGASTNVAVRLDDETLAEVDRVSDELRAKAGPHVAVGRFGRSDALRAIIRRGLERRTP